MERGRGSQKQTQGANEWCFYGLEAGTGDLNVGDVDLQLLEHVHGVVVDLDGLVGNSGNLRDVVHAALALLLLELEGDATNGATLNTLHKAGDETGDLVAHALGGEDSDLLTKALVGLKVKSQAGVVELHHRLGGLLDGLGTNTTHGA